jgi:CRP/FNR family cyclic AMP-dependent transcriptional regulator
MVQQSILNTFAGHAFLQPLKERHLMVLASGAEPFTAVPREFLAREGESATRFYLIQSGHVGIGTAKADSSDLLLVQTVGPGDVVGWSWLVAPYHWRFECWAMDKVEGIFFDAEWLREKCEQDTELGFSLTKHLLAVLAHRLEATRFQLMKQEKPPSQSSADRPRRFKDD